MFSTEVCDDSDVTVQLQSMNSIGQKGKKFISQELPIEAQFSPIADIAIEDIDQDGYLDLILGGNTTEIASYLGSLRRGGSRM